MNQRYLVAPLMGAWIEILMKSSNSGVNKVAPLMGAWIEMPLSLVSDLAGAVAPLMGAWIEITTFPTIVTGRLLSRPSWARGLKYSLYKYVDC